MMEKMKEREDTLKHMQNYGLGSDGKKAVLIENFVRLFGQYQCWPSIAQLTFVIDPGLQILRDKRTWPV
jgi:hypothetical protein